MTYAALSLIAAIVARLPASSRALLGRALGFIAGSLLRIRRSLVEAAMARAGIAEPAASAAEMYRSLGAGIVELLWLAAAPASRRAEAVARVAVDDASVAALEAASSSGPVVIFASHTGNWELAAAAAARLLAERGRRLAVVAKAIHARGVNAFVERIRRRMGVDVIAPRGALAAAQHVLERGDVVIMPIDQVPDRSAHGISVPFLGELAVTDRAPATLAWRARATVLVVVAERVAGGHRVRVLDAIAPPAGDDRAARRWIEAVTMRATSLLEGFVRRSPASWLWLHRRWRAPRERAGRTFDAPSSAGRSASAAG